MACLSCAYQFCFGCGAEWQTCGCTEAAAELDDDWDADDGPEEERDGLSDRIAITQARLDDEVQVRVVENGRLREVHVQVGQVVQLGPVYVQVLGPGVQVAHNVTQSERQKAVNEVAQ